MRGSLSMLALAALLAGCAHSTVHTLAPPPPMAGESRACTVAVGRVADEAGLDYGPDLRDYLREHGPCRTVLLVSDPHDERADFVVSGRVNYKDADQKSTLYAAVTPEKAGAAWLFALGVSPFALAGAILLPAGAIAHCQNPNTCKTFEKLGAASLGVGVALIGISIPLFSDNGGRIQLDAKVTAEFDVATRDGKSDHFTLRDDVNLRERPATKDEPTWGYENIYASLLPALLGRVFEHVATHLADLPLGSAAPAPPAAPPKPTGMSDGASDAGAQR